MLALLDKKLKHLKKNFFFAAMMGLDVVFAVLDS
jgi:hypothetical protein